MVDVGEKMRAVESEKCYTVTFRAAAEHTGPESVTQKQWPEKPRGSYLLEVSVQWPVMATDCCAKCHIDILSGQKVSFKRSG